jgi:hypothetical protein
MRIRNTGPCCSLTNFLFLEIWKNLLKSYRLNRDTEYLRDEKVTFRMPCLSMPWCHTHTRMYTRHFYICVRHSFSQPLEQNTWSVLMGPFLHPDNFIGWRFLFCTFFLNLPMCPAAVQFSLYFYFLWKNFKIRTVWIEANNLSSISFHIFCMYPTFMCAYLAQISANTVPSI